MPITITLVDDHALVRLGFKRLLEEGPDFQVVGEASGGPEALALLEQSQPQLLILDLNLPGGGFALLEQLQQRFPKLPVLVLSMHDDHASVIGSIRAGARGYLLKTAEPDQLFQAVQQVSAGQFYLHPQALAAMHGQNDGQPGPELTPREREVLQLLADGTLIPDVARNLHVSVHTVKSHLQSLYRKFGVSDRTQLVLAALQNRRS